MAVTRVEFHSGVDRKLTYVARLLRKAVAKGARVAVTGDEAGLRQLDAELWTSDPGDFLAHVRVVDGQAMPSRMLRTQVWLVAKPEAAHACSVLVNIGAGAPALDGPFQRFIDVVSLDASDREAGRQRWRGYAGAGLAIDHHAMDGVKPPSSPRTQGSAA